WSLRPLSREMLDYAATDTRHLPELRDELRRQLAAMGRLSWAEEEFGRLESLRWALSPGDGDLFLRIKGARQLSRRGLALLRELFNWRESVAAELDRATFRVMPNEALLALAGAPPATGEALVKVPGVSRRLVEERGRALFDALSRGLAV